MRKQRGWGAVVISLVFHAAVFTAIGVIVPRPPRLAVADNPPFVVSLRPSIPREKPRHTPLQPEQPKALSAIASARTLSAAQAQVARPDAAAPPQSPSQNSRADQGVSPAPVAPPSEESSRGLQALLRGTVGCDHGAMAHLTAEERARCADRFADLEARATPFSAIPANKRAFYDAVHQRSQALAHPDWAFTRQPHAMDNVHGGSLGESLVGSNLPLGVGCGVKLGGNGGKDTRSQSDRIKQDGMASVDIGPFKCGVVIPAGSLTPEVGIKSQP